ncbi:hypothetical protein [Alishewanella phage vB_AspM_Slickus01]|nr:hypothetical protein [Alishewanella phage vB_AspM_Slicko01]WGH49760.1 hypothetical protein [Alishewanella phage vB_AspM_Slickus01]
MTDKIFEKATRQALRFESTVGNRGLMTVEDLWNLCLDSQSKPSLNSVAKACNMDLKTADEENFVSTAKSSNNAVAQLKMDIVKHIINVRLAENAASKKALDNKAEAARIKAILAQRQENALMTASEEELTRRLAELSE